MVSSSLLTVRFKSVIAAFGSVSVIGFQNRLFRNRILTRSNYRTGFVQAGWMVCGSKAEKPVKSDLKNKKTLSSPSPTFLLLLLRQTSQLYYSVCQRRSDLVGETLRHHHRNVRPTKSSFGIEICPTMSCIQTNIIAPNANIGRTYYPLPWLSQPSYPKVRHMNVSSSLKVEHHKAFPKLICSSPSYRRCSPICFSGAKGNSKSENEPFSWDPLKRVLSGFKKERTVQDLLREQMQKEEFDGNGGGGGPIGGGGDGFGGGEDESFSGILNELVQVVLATIAFIFLYIYLIRGAELTRLARDYIKYLIWGTTTVRLEKAMRRWKRLYEKMRVRKETREDWLERAIITTPTWWHKPKKFAEEMQGIKSARDSQNAPPVPAQTQTQEIDSDNEFDDDEF